MTIPDTYMKGAADAVIAATGSSMTFYRLGIENETTDVYMEPKNSEYLRAVSGVGNWTDYRCFASVTADIQNGDRVVIDSVYYEVDNTMNYGSHIEFGLKETGEGT